MKRSYEKEKIYLGTYIVSASLHSCDDRSRVCLPQGLGWE